MTRREACAIGGAAVALGLLGGSGKALALERHPKIRGAIRELREAREYLEHAAHDFAGHRVDAIAAIDAAIGQLQKCLEVDRD